MTEIDTVGAENLSRRSQKRGRRRREKAEADSFNHTFKENLLPSRILPAFIWSLLISFLSVGNPLFTGLATNLQTQTLYAGMAMKAGQSPYADFFSSNGVLYHLLSWLGTFLGNPLVLVGLQFVALLLAGMYFYKLVAYFSHSRETADQLSLWFYLFILALGFGGLYASIFALPFVLTSLWFLVRYFENAVRDEFFIFYGIDAALVFMIYPKSVILWLVAGLVLLFYNIRQHRKARGLYQFLASLFGFLLIIYSVGYYTFIKQILGSAVSQTFFYNLQLDFMSENLLWVAGSLLLVLLCTGFLKNFVLALASMASGKHLALNSILILTFLAQLVFILGNPNVDLSQLVLLLPYGFIMALVAKEDKQDSLDLEELLTEEEEEPVFYSYLRSQFFLPLLVCLFIPMQPIFTFVLDGQVAKERTEVASYIKSHADKDALIYTWDNSAEIYVHSGYLSATRFIAAQPYLTTEENKSALVYDLNNSKAQYIVVNKELTLPAKLKSSLKNNYAKEDVGTSKLVLYKKK
ncbi:quinol oxidase [Streptococcus gallolyticus]|nr:quinol oxidase [Streptococcus gallolyticus]MBY5040715.1 quinol oxidase [Streptococcus gallolyticus]